MFQTEWVSRCILKCAWSRGRAEFQTLDMRVAEERIDLSAIAMSSSGLAGAANR